MCTWVRVSFGVSLFAMQIDQNMKKKTAKEKVKLQQQCSQSYAHFESGNHTSNIPNIPKALTLCNSSCNAGWEEEGLAGLDPLLINKAGIASALGLPGSKCHSICASQGMECCQSETTSTTGTWNCWKGSRGGQDAQRTGTPPLWRQTERSGVAQPGEGSKKIF